MIETQSVDVEMRDTSVHRVTYTLYDDDVLVIYATSLPGLLRTGCRHRGN